MPHVIVKLWPGKSESHKRRLAQAITRDVMEILNYGDESVSVAMEEVTPGKWADIVAVKGDPLADIRVLEHVAAVMKGGEIVKSP